MGLYRVSNPLRLTVLAAAESEDFPNARQHFRNFDKALARPLLVSAIVYEILELSTGKGVLE